VEDIERGEAEKKLTPSGMVSGEGGGFDIGYPSPKPQLIRNSSEWGSTLA
jgi:hypothetical protein